MNDFIMSPLWMSIGPLLFLILLILIGKELAQDDE